MNRLGIHQYLCGKMYAGSHHYKSSREPATYWQPTRFKRVSFTLKRASFTLKGSRQFCHFVLATLRNLIRFMKDTNHKQFDQQMHFLRHGRGLQG